MADILNNKLGDVSAITITTNDLEKSFTYYQKLGFTEVGRFDFPFSWMQISDGALLIMLREHQSSYIGLTYYVKELEQTISSLNAKGITAKETPTGSEMIKRYMIKSPDGLNISLVTYVDGWKQPEGPTMRTMSDQDMFNPDKYVNKICGMFGEFAHPVADLDSSIMFWEKLGFTKLSKNSSPYPWAILADDLTIVGLHQTADFSYPAITYFAADMKDKINTLKENGLTNFAERGGNNIVLTTPEDQRIFLFSMGT